MIEDDEDHRNLVCDALEAAGWRAEPAEDGIAGLGRILRVRPDVILLDLRMPRLGGARLLEMLRSTPQGSATRVVLTTGAEVTDELRRLADAVLAKPFGGDDVVRAVRRVTGAPRAVHPRA